MSKPSIRKALAWVGVLSWTTAAYAGALSEDAEARLRADRKLEEFLITARLEGIELRVSGIVKTLAQKERAERIARETPGVERVVNEIEIAPSEDKDFQIRERIAEGLRHYPYFTLFDSLEVGFQGGVAYLAGAVTQPWKKLEVEARVKKTEGVRAIENRIEVLPASIGDDRLRRRIAELLAGDGRFFDLAFRYPSPVHFVVKHRRVTLEGVVASDVDRHVLASLIRQGTLALSVDNRLKTDSEVRALESD
jgi:hyperosmotically inducible protein